ncbi:uncharacterized protein LOC123660006 [Melitaea cinxia]|uniref:uncharacterized protein LOC123660006 n=1 Tax=Melitaea cinxia TaxID=113334 RepID=UPI001E274231|nr:uncharacterized protein LOC123660006 [Melitaea cinxia]
MRILCAPENNYFVVIHHRINSYILAQMMEDQENFILENADFNDNVVTLRELCERRKILLQKKKDILNICNYQNKAAIQPVTTPLSQNQNLTPEIPLSENLTSEFTTLTTILDPPESMQNVDYNIPTSIKSNDVTENHNNDIDFTSHDNFFDNLSDITNLKSLSPECTEWFPEREIEENEKNIKKTQRRSK